MKAAWKRWRVSIRKKIEEKPFARLVGHFVNRSFRGGAESDSDEMDFNTGLLLMLLPIPGVFVSIFFYGKYSTFLQILRKDLIMDPYTASLGDEYLFVMVSIVVTGIIAVGGGTAYYWTGEISQIWCTYRFQQGNCFLRIW